VRGRVIPIGEVGPEIERRWRHLAGAAAEPNPFLEPDCLLPAARHGNLGRDVSLVVAESDDGLLQGLVPLRPVRSWHRSGRAALSSRPDDEEVPVRPVIGVPLLGGEWRDEAAAALLATVATASRSGGPGIVLFDRLHAEGVVARSLLAAAERLGMPWCETDRWERMLCRRPAPGAPAVPLGRERVRRLARRQRRISDRFGAEARVVDRTGSPQALSDLLGLEAAGWKGEAGTAMACLPQRAAFFEEMCGRFDAAGRFGIIALEANGTILASKCYVAAGEGVFLLKTAYDERYASFGPGVQLAVSTAEHIFSRTAAAFIDTCHAPSNDFYRDLFPDRLVITSVAVGVGGLLDRALVRAMPMAERVLGRLRHVSGAD
jgi:hypothetical protein